MENNLYQQINQNNPNNFGNLVSKFGAFWNDFQMNPRSAIQQLFLNNRILNNQINNFQGSPEQIVRNLMASGQMSQEQFNYINNMAVQFRTFIRK